MSSKQIPCISSWWSVQGGNGKQHLSRERESFLVSQLLIRPLHVRISGYWICRWEDNRISGYKDTRIKGYQDRKVSRELLIQYLISCWRLLQCMAPNPHFQFYGVIQSLKRQAHRDGEHCDVGRREEGGAGDGKEPSSMQHTIQTSGFCPYMDFIDLRGCSHVMSTNFWDFFQSSQCSASV